MFHVRTEEPFNFAREKKEVGVNLQYGATFSVHGIQNPIQHARKIVDGPRFSILCGEGAMKFA